MTVISAPLFCRLFRIVLLLVSISAGASALAADALPIVPSNGGIDAALQPFIDDHVIAGAVVLVADKDHVLDLEAIGYSDAVARKPMQANALFYIASMTKCFTSTALMMLVDEGKVNIDDPVEKYLPEFQDQTIEDQSGMRHPPQHPITIKEAMSHTAGLQKHTQPRRFNLEESVKILAKAPLKWEPSSKFEYSQGMEIAGRIVEQVSGMPYSRFIQERLLDPLEMKETTFWPDAALASRLALTHEYHSTTKTLEPLHLNAELIKDPSKCGTVPPIILSQFPASFIQTYAQHFARPSGGMFSTATDLSKFCRMLLSGGTYRGKKYLSPAAIKTMSSVQTGGLAVGGGGLQGYGLGFFVQKKALPGGCSVGSFGHHGSRKTQLWIDPHNQLAMILLVQCSELSNKQLSDLYAAYQKQAVAKYAKANQPISAAN